MPDRLTEVQRKRIMSRVRNKNTNIELLLRKKPWSTGLRYRIHYERCPGTPDIAFPSKKVAIFYDGDFWHGRNFVSEKRKYKPFWQNKIAGNILRDKRVNDELSTGGWAVLRFWGNDILKHTDECVGTILKNLS